MFKRKAEAHGMPPRLTDQQMARAAERMRKAGIDPATPQPVPAVPEKRPAVTQSRGLLQRRKEAKLQAQQHQMAIAELHQLANRLPDGEGVVSPDGLKGFIQFAGEHGVNFNEVPGPVRDVRLGLAQGGYFLATQTSLLLRDGETPVLQIDAALLKEVADKEFRGGSQGVTIPLGGGVRYRVGQTRGRMVTIGTHWASVDSGPLTITNQRVVYQGMRTTLEFLFAKLATMNMYADAIRLGVTNRQATSSFRVGDPELVAGMVRAAMDHRDEQLKIIQLVDAE